MSENNIVKSNIFKYTSKSKKKKQIFRFDLDNIDKEFNINSSTKIEKGEKSEKTQKKDDENKPLNNAYKIKNIDDLKVIPLKNIYCLYSAWKSSNLIFENFEKNILDKKNFEINYDTFEIMTKNDKACDELKNEKFWILYTEYLKRNNKIKGKNDFLKIINLAFSYMEFDCRLLLVYYLDKIKKYNPILKEDGKIEDKDGPYIDLLDIHIKNRINNLKENLSSNIKIKYKTAQKEKNKNGFFYEYTPFMKKNKK